MGKVLKVYTDGDLRVLVEGHTWTFNPSCCTLLPHGAQDINNTMNSSAEREEHTSKYCKFGKDRKSLIFAFLVFSLRRKIKICND